MIDIKTYAAIDIGSNAVRLLISTITKTADNPPHFKRTSMVRVPVRLGGDVFVNGEISGEKQNQMLDTMQAFQLLMKSYKVDHYKACATSAMRDAGNGAELTEKIKSQTGIEIEIIDGAHEAAMIAKTDLRELIQNDQTYLYLDVGGGSTELTIYSNGDSYASTSFNLGTIRLLNGLVDQGLWDEIENWIRTHVKEFNTVEMIGSGGNINHIFRRSGQKAGKPLEYFFLKEYNEKINSMSYNERVSELDMKLDRADVIVPATKIYLSAMKWGGARFIHVPKIGLTDGIIKALYNEGAD